MDTASLDRYSIDRGKELLSLNRIEPSETARPTDIDILDVLTYSIFISKNYWLIKRK